jgi:hypothetical protein
MMIAIGTAVNLANTRHGGSAHDAIHGYHAALWVPLIAVAISLGLTLVSVASKRRSARPNSRPQEARPDLVELAELG